MTDPVELIVEEAPVVEAPQLNETEQVAFKDGWRPKEDFEADPKNANKIWIPADEFVRRAPLFSKIDELKTDNFHTRKELTEVKQALKGLAEHHRKVRDVEYQRALKELQAQKAQAFEAGDFQALTAAEEEIDAVKVEKARFEHQAKQELQQSVQAPSPEYLDWAKENSWYMTDKEMTTDADGIAYSYLTKNKGANSQEVYAHVTERIKRMYPEKFEPKAARSNPIESGRDSTPASKQSGKYQLSSTEEEVARTLERTGVMTRAQYVAELKKIKER